ncbi:MAG: hypothetical protein AAGA75_23480 [Cyanobacteria bacterium P01_E01_bin.6]
MTLSSRFYKAVAVCLIDGCVWRFPFGTASRSLLGCSRKDSGDVVIAPGLIALDHCIQAQQKLSGSPIF